MVKRILLASVLAVGVILLLYGATEFKVKAEIKPTEVIVAKVDIPPHTEITEDMLNTSVVVPREGIPPNAILDQEEIIGKYTQVDYGIPKNGYFYQGKVVTQEELLDAERMKLKDGQRLWTVKADIVESHAGNLVPGVLVDVWFTGKDPDSKKVINGKLFEDVLVVGAKDRQAQDIVKMNTTSSDEEENDSSTRKDLYASVIQLALSDEQIGIIQKASQIGELTYIPQSGPIVSILDEEKDEEEEVDSGLKDKPREEQQEILEWIEQQ